MNNEINKNIDFNNELEEREMNPPSGMAVLFGALVIFATSIGGLIFGIVNSFFPLIVISPIIWILTVIILCGLTIVNPNEAVVLTFFGKYYGTIKKDGFFFINPFCSAFNPTAATFMEEVQKELSTKKGADKEVKSKSRGKKVSTKILTLNNHKQKVNDSEGNPVIIGSVVIWKVENPTKAVFNVDDYFEYLSIQCDAVMRGIARNYPYDTFDEHQDDEMTLRGSSLEIAEQMKKALQDKVDNAGLRILEVKITHLSYSEEIAAAMLKRQQATATIAAREKIVEGAVGMVETALQMLEKDDLIVLDDERKAAMVSNLLVVLCGDKEAQPIVNSGSIY